MIKKGTKLYSILNLKCPHCQDGEFFMAHPYNLKKAGDIHEKCPVCNEGNSKEPGFYFGSMFVSYTLGVIVFLTVYGLTYLIKPDAGFIVSITLIGVSLVVLGPLMYALSKIIWANAFYNYDKNLLEKKNQ